MVGSIPRAVRVPGLLQALDTDENVVVKWLGHKSLKGIPAPNWPPPMRLCFDPGWRPLVATRTVPA